MYKKPLTRQLNKRTTKTRCAGLANARRLLRRYVPVKVRGHG